MSIAVDIFAYTEGTFRPERFLIRFTPIRGLAANPSRITSIAERFASSLPEASLRSELLIGQRGPGSDSRQYLICPCGEQ